MQKYLCQGLKKNKTVLPAPEETHIRRNVLSTIQKLQGAVEVPKRKNRLEYEVFKKAIPNSLGAGGDVCAHAHGGQKTNVGVIFQKLSIYYETQPLVGLELTEQTRMVIEPQGAVCLGLPSTEITSAHHHDHTTTPGFQRLIRPSRRNDMKKIKQISM